jgi:hypothetical protein
MSDDSWHQDATKTARTLQIIVPALAAGVAVFLVLVLTVIRPQAKQAPPTTPISFTMMAFLFVGACLIARAIAISIVVKKGRREIANGTYRPIDANRRMILPPPNAANPPGDACRNEKYLLAVYQATTIIACALFEGPGFLATIAYMIEGNPLSLCLAIVLILGVIAHFPTQAGVITWVEQQMETLEMEKAVR